MLFHDIHFALDEFANQPKLDIPLHFSDKLDTQSVYLREFTKLVTVFIRYYTMQLIARSKCE